MTLAPPASGLRAIVVVPAHNEAERIAACVAALAGQHGVCAADYEVLLVLDRCTDRTRELAISAAGPDLSLHAIEADRPGAGAARRTGMELACRRLMAIDRPGGLIASTDADSVVAPDWLGRQLELVGQGARAIGGHIELDPAEATALPRAAIRARLGRSAARMDALADRTGAEHHYFSGASLALTAEAYQAIGGLPDQAALEDEALQQVLERSGVPIVRPMTVRVTTSARTNGRAERGLAHDLRLSDWRARRTFRAEQFSLAELTRTRDCTVSVIIPAREVAGTIGGIVSAIAELQTAGLLDELVVIDAASTDGTAERAAAAGATVFQESEILCTFGPARGKGDAMWRGLAATTGELVVYVDGDTENFRADFVVGLLGPLITHREIALVKGAFRRPMRVGSETRADEGGRVTELLARPLLNLYAPELAGFDQPLAGELAGRRELLASLPFSAGYGVEIAMLIDACQMAGLSALAQVDLGVRQNRHQSLRELSAMSYAVMAAAGRRLPSMGPAITPGPLALPPRSAAEPMEIRAVVVDERPALQTLIPHQSAQTLKATDAAVDEMMIDDGGTTESSRG